MDRSQAGAAPAPYRRPWPFPFADGTAGRLSGRTWLLLVAGFLALHFLALWISTRTGNFDPRPNHDHVRLMRQILAHGYPTLAKWPPLFAYYLTLKWWLTGVLGLPYWWGKLLVDPLPFVASGVLSTQLGARLTQNRWLALASGVGLTAAPLFALASAEGLAVLLFQPLFLGALLLLVRELQREAGPRWEWLALAGTVLGLATLVRANPQFLLVALAPLVWGVFRRARRPRPAVAALATLAVAAAAQALVLVPWGLVQRQSGRSSGVLAAPIFYKSFYNGVVRQEGNRIAVALERGEGPRRPSFSGLVRFHLHWLRHDPAALLALYGRRLGRAWYLSSSGRWDRWILLLHAPLLALALLGIVVWTRRAAGDPALWLTVLVIAYMWMVSALASGLARYSAPLYGLIALAAGVAMLPWVPAPRAVTVPAAGRRREDPSPG